MLKCRWKFNYVFGHKKIEKKIYFHNDIGNSTLHFKHQWAYFYNFHILFLNGERVRKEKRFGSFASPSLKITHRECE